MEIQSNYDSLINKKEIEYKSMLGQKNHLISKINLENKELLSKMDDASEEHRISLTNTQNAKLEGTSNCETHPSFNEVKQNIKNHGIAHNYDFKVERLVEMHRVQKNNQMIKNTFLF